MKDNKVIETKIKNVLNRIRPYLQGDGIVYIRMLGACAGCGSIDATIEDCIESILLEEVEGVIGVENIE